LRRAPGLQRCQLIGCCLAYALLLGITGYDERINASRPKNKPATPRAHTLRPRLSACSATTDIHSQCQAQEHQCNYGTHRQFLSQSGLSVSQ
jgi:hypothetical protein